MTIEFLCPECSSAIRVPDSASGKKGTCPGCGTKLIVPVVEIPPTQPEPSTAQTPPIEPPSPATDKPKPRFPDFTQPAPPRADSTPTEAAPPVVEGSGPAPVFGSAPAADSPGPPDHAPNVASPRQQPPMFPGATPATSVTPASTSVARQTRRRARRKRGGMWFPVFCGVAIVGGMAWLYLKTGPDISGERSASFAAGERLESKIIARNAIDVSKEVKDTVLGSFEEDVRRIRTPLIEVEFGATSAGLEVQVLTGRDTRFVKFAIDEDLRAWYDENATTLQAGRDDELYSSLKGFFEDWDVAIRNQQGVDGMMKYRDSVGLAACVEGLGFNVNAMIGSKLYQCVYEDEGNLYFLLPKKTRKFRIVGRKTGEAASLFPGEFDVTIRAAQSS